MSWVSLLVTRLGGKHSVWSTKGRILSRIFEVPNIRLVFELATGWLCRFAQPLQPAPFVLFSLLFLDDEADII